MLKQEVWTQLKNKDMHNCLEIVYQLANLHNDKFQ